MWFYLSDHAYIRILRILCFLVIAMVGNLKKHLGVVAATTIAVVVIIIYLRDGAIFQYFANGSFKKIDGILFGNKQTKPNH